jgi:hypothetical protein
MAGSPGAGPLGAGRLGAGSPAAGSPGARPPPTRTQIAQAPPPRSSGRQADEIEPVPSSVTAVVSDPRLDPDRDELAPDTPDLDEPAPETASFRAGEQLPSEAQPWSQPDSNDEDDDEEEEEPRTQPRPSIASRRPRLETMEIDGVDRVPTPKAVTPRSGPPWNPNVEGPTFRPRPRAGTVMLPEHPQSVFKAPPRRRAHTVAMSPAEDNPLRTLQAKANARLGTVVMPAAPDVRRRREGTLEMPAAPRDAPADEPTAGGVVDEPTEIAGDEDPPSERPPAAVRPLGRLGGDEGGWALSLDFRRPQPRPAPAPVEDDEPTAPPPLFPPTARMALATETDKLEAWLAAGERGRAQPEVIEAEAATRPPNTGELASLALLGKGWSAVAPETPSNEVRVTVDRPGATPRTPGDPPLPQTMSFGPPTAPFAAFDFNAFIDKPVGILAAPTLVPLPEPLPVGKRVSEAPPTPDLAEAAELGALPFGLPPPPKMPLAEQTMPALGAAEEPTGDTAADRLERWLSAIEDTNQMAVAEAPPPAALVPLHARVLVTAWDDALRLGDALARRGVDEVTWRSDEVRLIEAVAAEAAEGKVALLVALRTAIRAVRSADEPEGLELERYATVKVALEGLGRSGVSTELLLGKLGVTLQAWERARAVWARRARRDPEVRARVRAALADARRATAGGAGMSRRSDLA